MLARSAALRTSTSPAYQLRAPCIPVSTRGRFHGVSGILPRHLRNKVSP